MSERPVDELEQLKSAFDELDSDYVDLQKENERYREALENIMYASATIYSREMISAINQTALKALEESE